MQLFSRLIACFFFSFAAVVIWGAGYMRKNTVISGVPSQGGWTPVLFKKMPRGKFVSI